MKKILSVLSMCVFLIVVLSACTIAPADGSVANTSSVNEAQMYIVGLLSTAFVYGLNLFAKAYPKVQLSRGWLTVLLYLVALGLSVIWGGITFPAFEAFSEPVGFVTSAFDWVTALLIALAPSVSFATLIYNILLKRVFDGWAGRG